MGMFIEVSVRDPGFLETGEARKLVSACAVNIFEPAERGVAVNRDQEDECTLCGRCLEIGGDRLQIVKLYEKAVDGSEERA